MLIKPNSRFAERLFTPLLWKLCAIYWLVTITGYAARRLRYLNDWSLSTFWHYLAEGMQWWTGNFLVMPILIASACYISQKNYNKLTRFIIYLFVIPLVFSIQTSIGVYALYFINNYVATLDPLHLNSVASAFRHYTINNWWNLDFQMYLLYLLLGIGWQWYETGVSAQLEQETLSRKLIQSELATFRAQLNPHFLFNVLNSIAALVRTERKPDALNALNELSLLLRGILDNRLSNFSTLEAELTLLDNYVYMQKLRFGDKLHFIKKVKQDALNQRVPGMLLLPFVENAVVHGSKTHCDIALEANIISSGLRICISNPLDEQSKNQGFGIGIGNNKARLTLIYGKQCDFQQRIENNRFMVEITLPSFAESLNG